MKLVGSYTSPFVRKLSILLLEKGITFEFINELPYNADNGVAQFNPLGKVPVLVTEEGECWFDSPIIAEYIELMNVAPAMLPRDPLESLRVRKIEALADGIMDAWGWYRCVNRRVQRRSSLKMNCYASGRKSTAVWMCWKDIWSMARSKPIRSIWRLSPLPVPSDISISAALRQVGVSTAHTLVKLVENLFSRESFARTEPPKA